MKKLYVSYLILVIAIGLVAFMSPEKQSLRLKTSKGAVIKVIKDHILYNGKKIATLKYFEDVLWEDKANRLIEDHNKTFLFLAMDGSPSALRLNVFLITSKKATMVADAILTPIKDYDRDGYLEFGGAEFTEAHPHPDSMYYVPNAYYEIRKGEIIPERALTISQDIKINGIYLTPSKQPHKDGSCCRVILKPKRKQ